MIFFNIKNKAYPKQPTPDTSAQERKIRDELAQTEKQISETHELSDELIKKRDYLRLKSEWLRHNNGKLLLPGRFDEYDLILPVGPSCHVSMLLDRFQLRQFSSPFEWTGGKEPANWFQEPDIHRDSRFHEKIQAISDNFKNWFVPENIKYVAGSISLQKQFHKVVNIKTNIQYLHEFPANQDIVQHMPEFIKKMTRRKQHMYDAIGHSHKILILWLSNIWGQRVMLEKTVSDKDIKWAVKKLHKMYPDKLFDLVFFEPDATQGKFEYQRQIVAPGANRIKSNHFLTDTEYTFGHLPTDAEHPYVHVISEMLDNIHLSENAFTLPQEEKN
jgi:hypothetical protein